MILLFPQLEFCLYCVEKLHKQPVGYHRFIQVDGSISIRDVRELSHRCLCATTIDAIPLSSDRAAQWDTQRMWSAVILTSFKSGIKGLSSGVAAPRSTKHIALYVCSMVMELRVRAVVA
ncbi:hypothetical protein AMECASPLE_017082 [Ameca splendens]|uniref:Uncharacterized protein n=1 Tax=Ameca splendens TaxID=208324 RepID=A0ABV0YDN0_9TELE